MKEVIVALGKVKQETNNPVLDRRRFIGRVATILSRPTFWAHCSSSRISKSLTKKSHVHRYSFDSNLDNELSE
jgi:hypothetical protein